MAGSLSDVTATVESQEPLDDIFLNIQVLQFLQRTLIMTISVFPKLNFSRILKA